ncbi:MAG: beta-L-arabinofuranosidase domain-containing protein [Anaerolineales bacterium]
MNELSASQVTIQDTLWTSRQLMNARVSIFHQWQQLENSRCIDNFRLAASQKDGFREGWFFADSDAYKWLDAAARVYASWPSADLKELMNEFIRLINCVQMQDGYIYTYNQIHFPGERWGNLLIEHELYCHGHLIEAGVSHFEATNERTALEIACKAANLLVSNFLVAAPDKTSGHEEVEIALLRLYQVTNNEQYLELARQFLERRGQVRLFAPLIIQQNTRVAQRNKFVQGQRELYLAEHPEQSSFRLPPDNFAKKPYNAKLRWAFNALNGKYFQQHAPIRKQTVPVGHSVRFAYLETAIAMLHRMNRDLTLLPAQQEAWECMVERRMYITGGIGSLPELEGFGCDYELDPEIAYAETCAALGSLYWNWEMALITGEACYSDLFEWQLYNAAAVGMGLSGDSYLYNNPLLCRGGITRRAWFLVPCCPSNLSRTWASLGKYIYSFNEKNLWVHQYIGNQTMIDSRRWKVKLESSLPWEGKVRFILELATPADFSIHFRLPSWAQTTSVRINGEPFRLPASIFSNQQSTARFSNASGYDPHQARFLPIQRVWSPGDMVDLDFDIPILLRRASPRLRGHKGKSALTRGPLVYCLESVDNPDIDIFKSKIDPNSIRALPTPALLGGIWSLCGKTTDGKDFTAIPYHLWANRGESKMTVWINT